MTITASVVRESVEYREALCRQAPGLEDALVGEAAAALQNMQQLSALRAAPVRFARVDSPLR